MRPLQGKLMSYINTWVSSDRTGYHNFILYVVSMAEFNCPHPDHPEITLLDESLMMLQVLYCLLIRVMIVCPFHLFENINSPLQALLQTWT